MASKINRLQLAAAVHELCDIPLDRRLYPAAGMKIVGAIIKAITAALQRGEDVHVKGFGIFRVVERPARRIGHTIIYPRHFDTAPTIIPAKKVVKFFPAEDLRAMMNHDGPMNYKERRATRTWK